MQLELKVAILKAGWTQRQLARHTGISENRLSDIVQGWKQPRPDEALTIARFLGVSTEALLPKESRKVSTGGRKR